MVAPRVALVALAFASPLAAQKQVPGWTYTMNMTIDSGATGRAFNMAMRVAVTENRLRQEWIQVSGMSGPANIEGMYMLMGGPDSTMVNVMPEQRMVTIVKFPPEGFDASRMAITPHTSTNVEDLGDGGRVFGHPTHHIRVTLTGTIDRTLGDGRVCTMPADGVNDMWIAGDVDLTPAMLMALKQFGVSDEDIIPKSGRTPLPKGLPLRMIMRSQRRGVTVTTTMEYRDIAQQMFDASYFEAPKDYHVMDMRKMLSRVPQATMDSIRRSTEKNMGESCTDARP